MNRDGNADRLRVASYNVHGWKGVDGRADPERTMDLVKRLDADMVALQEVVLPHKLGTGRSLHDMAEDLGYHVTFGQTMLRSDSRYGNALLSRDEPAGVTRHDLTCSGREPRGALDTMFSRNGMTLRFMATHLGLRRQERRCQLETLARLFQNPGADLFLFMGDLNEWLPWGKAHRHIRLFFGDAGTPGTFPSRWPLLALDRIYVRPGFRLVSLRAETSFPAREASDHLPLVAEVDVSRQA